MYRLPTSIRNQSFRSFFTNSILSTLAYLAQNLFCKICASCTRFCTCTVPACMKWKANELNHGLTLRRKELQIFNNRQITLHRIKMGLGLQTTSCMPRGCMATWVFTCGIFSVVLKILRRKKKTWPTCRGNKSWPTWSEKKILTHMAIKLKNNNKKQTIKHKKNLEQTLASCPPPWYLIVCTLEDRLWRRNRKQEN